MLNEAQRTVLATHMRANTDADVVAALAIRNDTELTRLYNLESTLEVWREAVTPNEYREVMIWTDIDQMTAGKARIWEWITENMTLSVDATKANIRAGVNEAFNAAGTAAFLVIAKEMCSVTEEIYADKTGSPATRVFVGTLTIVDTGRALNENI